MITEESELHLVNDETTWFVDSRVSFHLTPDRKCFPSYRARDHSCVRIGNEGSCRIVDIGSKAVQADNSGDNWEVVRGILPIEGNPTCIYYTKDAEAKRTGRKDEPNLMERVRSMLAHAKLPKMFWAETLMPATYVINISPSAPLDEDTLQGIRL